MNEERLLRRMGELARGESVPRFDVSGAVLRSIRTARLQSDAPLAIFAGISAMAAAVVLAYAVETWSAWQDPIAGLLCSMETVLQ